jgi:hypothetical protein
MSNVSTGQGIPKMTALTRCGRQVNNKSTYYQLFLVLGAHSGHKIMQFIPSSELGVCDLKNRIYILLLTMLDTQLWRLPISHATIIFVKG